MSERIHPRALAGYGENMEALGTDAARLTYDQTAELMGSIADELERQANADTERGRLKLAAELNNAKAGLDVARAALETAWCISAPHMTAAERGETNSKS